MFKNIELSKTNTILLINILINIAFIMLVPDIVEKKWIYNILFSVLFISASFSIKNNRDQVIALAITFIIFKQATLFVFENRIMESISNALSFLFFFIIVIKLIAQVAKSKNVTKDIILESVNGYLLIGYSGSILISIIYMFNNQAYAIPFNHSTTLADFMYFGFITMTTIGYGDITPISELAKFASVILGVTGQLYLTVIIAMLVGKFLKQK